MSTTTTMFSGMWSSLWNLGLGWLQGISNALLKMFSIITGGIGTSIGQVFQNWGYTVSGQTGIFAPIAVVAILGIAGLVGYLFVDFYGAEKDISGAEEDL